MTSQKWLVAEWNDRIANSESVMRSTFEQRHSVLIRRWKPNNVDWPSSALGGKITETKKSVIKDMMIFSNPPAPTRPVTTCNDL